MHSPTRPETAVRIQTPSLAGQKSAAAPHTATVVPPVPGPAPHLVPKMDGSHSLYRQQLTKPKGDHGLSRNSYAKGAKGFAFPLRNSVPSVVKAFLNDRGKRRAKRIEKQTKARKEVRNERWGFV